ncbi:hypothetical protein ATORI0001_0802 [Lancefieldella rimae ATCC 49626]|uniref:Uncharacterized protein n=1 Tax=Lancefieldella rimae (strain ATCC 49626 / DSM 7090 / CCUG 31168 / NBRC 15546 / VPI D140H-11A) TaxID=553184 RepID=B9CL88_LANR4|nr:hypothetical protein ATORI0001_0802 [Lancefieldella rimae ATCC 49626]
MPLVVQLARLFSSLDELPELSVLPVLPEMRELCSAAKNAPSMAWTAILTASLAYINHTCCKFGNLCPTWRYFGSTVPAVPTWRHFGSTINSRQRR